MKRLMDHMWWVEKLGVGSWELGNWGMAILFKVYNCMPSTFLNLHSLDPFESHHKSGSRVECDISSFVIASR